MKITLLFVVLLVSINFATIYSSDLRDQASSNRIRIDSYEDSPEDISFLSRKACELGDLTNLPSLQGLSIALEVTRLENDNAKVRVCVGLYREDYEFFINREYDQCDEANKIFKSMVQYFIDQPERRLISLMMQDLPIWESEYTSWRIFIAGKSMPTIMENDNA